MAGANSNISLVGLDFNTIKDNLITFLKSPGSPFTDYNFQGSGLNTLVDVLAYNTQYNAFYLNMVANEMFMDTALQRSSVVSHAKLLNYVPQSATAPTAFANVVFYGVTTSSFTLPPYTSFMSEAINGVNYNFVTVDSQTVNTSSNTAIFNNVELKQGIPVTQTFVVDGTANPNYKFELTDNNIDVSTLTVTVQVSQSNTTFEVYNLTKDYIHLNGSSTVYFLQEGLNGNYEISFGDGVLGKKLSDGNYIRASYLVTQGTSGSGANNFVLMSSINNNYTGTSVYGIVPASQGSEKESIESVKYQATKTFAAQSRGVSVDDYINLINQNDLGISFDGVNVWGGEDNDPPVYGQVFFCLKPTGLYTLSSTQKQKLIQNVIKPISVMTVTPVIVDPDYTYVRIVTNVIYDPSKTTKNQTQLQQDIKNSIISYVTSSLNQFNSTFLAGEVTSVVKSADQSVISSELSVQVQKKIYPNLVSNRNYNLYYGVPLQKGMFQSSVNSYPALQFTDPNNKANTITGVFIEEVPQFTFGIDSIDIMNPGYGYQFTPTISIIGDGYGATATATINNMGQIDSVTITNSGNNYTSAYATVVNDPYDKTGQNSSLQVNLQGKYGTLRTFYNSTNNTKTILNKDAGTIDYEKGIITLTSFGPVGVDNDLAQLTVSSTPTTTLIPSTQNRLLTLDINDTNSVIVNVISK